MKFIENLSQSLKQEMRNRDKLAVSTIRMMLDQISKKEQQLKDAAIKKSVEFTGITEAEVITTIQKFKDQIKEETELFNRVHSQSKVLELIRSQEIIDSYLPKQMDMDELLVIIKEAIRSTEEKGYNIGTILKIVKPIVESRIDNKTLSETVKTIIDQTKN